MRITGGKAARRILKVPKGLAVRPTPDLVKQAVFNSLGARVAGARVLELFAGTGALSLECLSRGAESAVCVEKSSRHAEVLRQNFQTAGFPAHTLQVRVQDVFAALAQLAASGQKFELVMAPLYGRGNKNGEGAGVRILSYRVPANPREKWETAVINDSMHMTHNFEPVNWTRQPGGELLVAGKETTQTWRQHNALPHCEAESRGRFAFIRWGK